MLICKEHEELIQNCTSIIECSYFNLKIGHGTCFFYKTESSKILLVTNKHVITKCNSAKIYVTVNNYNSNVVENIILDIKLKDIVHFQQEYDLCVIDITDIYNDLIKDNYEPQIKFIEKENILIDYSNLQLIQEVIMVGYPSGLIDTFNNKPIIRTGTTATNINNRFENKDIFLINVATFMGSSGSPIFIVDKNGKISLIGINFECRNHNTKVNKKKKDQSSKVIGYVDIPNNIGVVLNSKIIKDFLSQQ